MNNLVILPLEEDVLWDIIENGQQQPIVVDVASSYANLNDKILYYISNAELDVTFDWSGCDFDTKNSIMLSYINLNRIYKNDELNRTLFDLMLCYKGIETDCQGIFTLDQCIDFINNNLELFSKLIPFIDSAILLIGNGFAPLNKYFQPDMFEQVTDNTLSLNVSCLFSIPEFVVYYSILDQTNLKWYTIQFDKPIYDNNTLHNIVFEKQSGLAAAAYATMIEMGLISKDQNNVSLS